MFALPLTATPRILSWVAGKLRRPAKSTTLMPRPSNSVEQFLLLRFVKSKVETKADGRMVRVETRVDDETGLTFNCTFPVNPAPPTGGLQVIHK